MIAVSNTLKCRSNLGLHAMGGVRLTCPIQKLAQYPEGWLLWKVHQDNPSHKRHALPHTSTEQAQSSDTAKMGSLPLTQWVREASRRLPTT